MGNTTLRLRNLILILSFIAKISSSQLPPSLTEYVIATLGQQPATLPNLSNPQLAYQSQYGPGYQNYKAPLVYQNPPRPSSALPLTAVTNLAAAIPEKKIPKTPCLPKPSGMSSSTFDSNVLNNLAIALQLLIVSNILNTPPENLAQSKFDFSKLDLTPKLGSLPISPLTSSFPVKSPILQSLPYTETALSPRKVYAFESPTIPNTKFMGSSGFLESPSFSPLTSPSPRYSPRSSVSLMSPYEALGPNSPYSDPILSTSYGYSKNDFQSPYASILAADTQNDLFSFTDLF